MFRRTLIIHLHNKYWWYFSSLADIQQCLVYHVYFFKIIRLSGFQIQQGDQIYV